MNRAQVGLLSVVLCGCATVSEGQDSAEVCEDITPDGAEDAYRVAACEYSARCYEGASTVDHCIATWDGGSPQLPGTCSYDDFDPCAAEKCILSLTAPRRSCERGFPGINDCFGMFTTYECLDF